VVNGLGKRGGYGYGTYRYGSYRYGYRYAGYHYDGYRSIYDAEAGNGKDEYFSEEKPKKRVH